MATHGAHPARTDPRRNERGSPGASRRAQHTRNPVQTECGRASARPFGPCLRQVAAELVAQFGAPWPDLWDTLRSCYAPDEIEAARRLAPWLERAEREGVSPRLARRITAALLDGKLVPAPRRPAANETLAHVPLALQRYVVEAPDLSRYDHLSAKVSA